MRCKPCHKWTLASFFLFFSLAAFMFRILSLQANRLTKIEGLDALVNLEELYLSENGIEHIEGLRGLKKLRLLDLAVNRFATIAVEEMDHLKDTLEEFWCAVPPHVLIVVVVVITLVFAL